MGSFSGLGDREERVIKGEYGVGGGGAGGGGVGVGGGSAIFYGKDGKTVCIDSLENLDDEKRKAGLQCVG